jgi:hypothetical protein
MLSIFSAQARRLGEFLSARGVQINHTSALNVLAVCYGVRDWRTLRAGFCDVSIPEWDSPAWGRRLQNGLAKFHLSVSDSDAVQAIQFAYHLTQKTTIQAVLDLMPESLRNTVQKQVTMGSKWVLRFRYGMTVYVDVVERDRHEFIDSGVMVTHSLISELLSKLPKTLENQSSVLPGTVCRCSRVDSEGVPIDIQIDVEIFVPSSKYSAFALQDWRGMVLIGNNDVRCQALRSMVYWLSENPFNTVLVIDPFQFAAKAYWDVAGFAPRAVDCQVTEFSTELILAAVKRSAATHVVLCWCGSDKQMPLANKLLARGIRVIYDVYPFDEIPNLSIPLNQQLRIEV